MAKLYNHGRVVVEYVRTEEGTGAKSIVRLMSDGKLLIRRGRGWKIAKLKPEFMENPDRLVGVGYKKLVQGQV